MPDRSACFWLANAAWRGSASPCSVSWGCRNGVWQARRRGAAHLFRGVRWEERPPFAAVYYSVPCMRGKRVNVEARA